MVLPNLRLPGMNGAALAEAYKGTPGPHAPIIVLTASQGWDEQVARIKPADVIAKPLELDELLARLERIVRSGAAGHA